MNWKTKGLIQGGLSKLPFGFKCNYLLQRSVGSLRSDARVDGTFLADVTVLFERMARLDLTPQTSRILEIGTGWLPVFPICLALAGFRNIFTVDLHPHLRPSAIRRTLMALGEHLNHPVFTLFASAKEVQENFRVLMAAKHTLSAANISYLAPCDATSTHWPAGSMDLIVSNNVFEHVPVQGLVGIFSEGKRLLRPGGHILHCINCGDHYAYADSSITQLNYLQFSENEWQRWNNSIHFQNRLRPIDFVDMAESEHFRVESAEFSPRRDYLEQLQTLEVAPEFRHYAPEQLASTSLTLIASVPQR